MKSFIDLENRTWKFSINMGMVKIIKSRLGIDILYVGGDEKKSIFEIISDPVNFIDILFLLCEEQAEKLGVSDLDFAKAIDGTIYEDASFKFQEELVDFFPERQKKLLAKLLEQMKKVKQATMTEIEAKMDEQILKIETSLKEITPADSIS